MCSDILCCIWTDHEQQYNVLKNKNNILMLSKKYHCDITEEKWVSLEHIYMAT